MGGWGPGAGGGGGELVFTGHRVSVRGDRKFWRWMEVMVVPQCSCTQRPWAAQLEKAYSGEVCAPCTFAIVVQSLSRVDRC